MADALLTSREEVGLERHNYSLKPQQNLLLYILGLAATPLLSRDQGAESG